MFALKPSPAHVAKNVLTTASFCLVEMGLNYLTERCVVDCRGSLLCRLVYLNFMRAFAFFR